MSANLRPQLWEMMADADCVARWMLRGTIELDKLLSVRSGEFPKYRTVLGFDGDDNVIFVSMYRGVFMVCLVSMQFEKIFETNPFNDDGTIHPFTSFYTPGNSIHLHCKHTKNLVLFYNWFIEIPQVL